MKYILGVDFGGTTIVAKLYDEKAVEKCCQVEKVPYLHPSVGAVEIQPNALWDLFVQCVRNVIKEAGIDAKEIKSLGISTQRSTLTIWDRNTGMFYCNLLSWQDVRCSGAVDTCNKSWMFKLINTAGYILYFILRRNKFLIMKLLTYKTVMASSKLYWLINKDSELRQQILDGKWCIGCLDTWLIWKLSKGKRYVTDFSSASATGFWDPFIAEWSDLVELIYGLKKSLLPQVLPTRGDFCDVDKELFGASFPLSASFADTSASLFAQSCYESGQSQCILGTGCFFQINTGSYVHASIKGLVPLVGWKTDGDIVYCCEGQVAGISASIEWAHKIGLFDDVSKTSDMARTVEDSDGVFFIPAFFGLSAPHDDDEACAGFLGIKKDTSKLHMLRAILESIAFRVYEVYKTAVDETHMPISEIISVSGGVSKNNFLMQLISSLTGEVIERAEESNTSLLGAVYLAGIQTGVWKDKEEVATLRKPCTKFTPDHEEARKYRSTYESWLKAVERCKQWYQHK